MRKGSLLSGLAADPLARGPVADANAQPALTRDLAAKQRLLSVGSALHGVGGAAGRRASAGSNRRTSTFMRAAESPAGSAPTPHALTLAPSPRGALALASPRSAVASESPRRGPRASVVGTRFALAPTLEEADETDGADRPKPRLSAADLALGAADALGSDAEDDVAAGAAEPWEARPISSTVHRAVATQRKGGAQPDESGKSSSRERLQSYMSAAARSHDEAKE
jgi:hypothetical protein